MKLFKKKRNNSFKNNNSILEALFHLNDKKENI